MKHLIVFLSAGLFLPEGALVAQFAASPASLSFSMRRGQQYPNNSTRYPANQSLAITGTGAWSISSSGALSSQCGGPCFDVSPKTGTGNMTVTVSFTGRGAESLPEGEIAGSIVIESRMVPVTLRVLPPRAYDENVYSSPGYPVGCGQSSVFYSQQDTCAIHGEMPGAANPEVVAPATSRRDYAFGSEITRLTPAGYNIQYSTVTSFSATSKYVMTSDRDGRVVIFDRVSRSIAFPGVPGININYASWDPQLEDKIWYMDGATLKYRILTTNETVLAANYAIANGTRLAMPSISMGGTSGITDDGWWVFSDGPSLCAVNLNNLTPSVQESQTRCVNVTSLGINYLDFAQVTQTDSVSKKRYVVLMGIPANHLFSVQSDRLVHESMIPTGAADVWPAAHATTGQDSEGRQILFWNYSEIYSNRSFQAALYLNRGAEMTQPVETGGGLRLIYQNDPQNSGTDAHFGCTWRGLCVAGSYGNSGGIRAANIVTVKSGANCEIETRSAHGFNTGTPVLIGGALGVTGLNGVSAVDVTGATSFTLTGKSCEGTYLGGSGSAVHNTPTAIDSPNRGELIVHRPGHEVRRIGHHRSKPYNNDWNLSSYFGTPRASLSRDGRYISFASNQGIPEDSSVWIADTGYSAQYRISPGVSKAGSTSVELRYNVPAGQPSALVTVSRSPDLVTDLAARFYDGQTIVSRKTTIQNLIENTTYYYRISTGSLSYTGSFKTEPALTRR